MLETVINFVQGGVDRISNLQIPGLITNASIEVSLIVEPGVDQKKQKDKRAKRLKAEGEYDNLKNIYVTLFFGTVYTYLNYIKNPFNQ